MADYFCDFCGTPAQVEDECLYLDAAQPGAYEQVVSLAPYTAICPRCGAPVVIPRPTLYTDNKRGFAVRIRPSGFRTPLYAGPLNYVLRDTQLLLEFREKIMLLTNGYDDVAVELLKHKTIQANPKDDFVDVICLGVAEDHLQMHGVCRDHRTIAFNTPIELYESTLQELPDGWHPEGFAQVDLAWLTDKLPG